MRPVRQLDGWARLDALVPPPKCGAPSLRLRSGQALAFFVRAGTTDALAMSFNPQR